MHFPAGFFLKQWIAIFDFSKRKTTAIILHLVFNTWTTAQSKAANISAGHKFKKKKIDSLSSLKCTKPASPDEMLLRWARQPCTGTTQAFRQASCFKSVHSTPASHSKMRTPGQTASPGKLWPNKYNPSRADCVLKGGFFFNSPFKSSGEECDDCGSSQAGLQSQNNLAPAVPLPYAEGSILGISTRARSPPLARPRTHLKCVGEGGTWVSPPSAA